jgi:hypothetical protein
MVFNWQMKFCFLILILALAVGGCRTQTDSKAESRAAFLAGQEAARRQREDAQMPGVTVVGPVQTPRVPWVAGLTLAQAIATANYLDPREPGAILITRQGETAKLDPKVLVTGALVPLEPGDVIEIQP